MVPRPWSNLRRGLQYLSKLGSNPAPPNVRSNYSNFEKKFSEDDVRDGGEDDKDVPRVGRACVMNVDGVGNVPQEPVLDEGQSVLVVGLN